MLVNHRLGIALATLAVVVAAAAPAAWSAKIPVAKSNYAKVTLELAGKKTTYHPGETITVSYSTQEHFADNGWIGVIPSEVTHGDEDHNDEFDVAFEYLHKKAKGTVSFKAPAKLGNWDLRMHNTDNHGKEIAFVSFEVK
ncbi:MAG: hypothetical protein JWM80_3694 [Cyanobacteria bacterium RYN_339]|nr:hypothetical protein [Cyanobacteria bacterium RYN_339]